MNNTEKNLTNLFFLSTFKLKIELEKYNRHFKKQLEEKAALKKDEFIETDYSHLI